MRLAITPPLVLVVFVFIAAVEISAQSVKNSTLPATPWEEAQWKRFMVGLQRLIVAQRDHASHFSFLSLLRITDIIQQEV